MKKTIEITAPLPFFNGLHDTCLDVDWGEYENIVDKLIAESEFLGKPTSYADYEFDDKAYEKFIIEELIQEFMKYAPSYVKNVELARIIHPKEKISTEVKAEVKIELSDNFREEIRKTMVSEEKWFRTIIKDEWSDREGFWSFLSNKYEKWLSYLDQTDINTRNSVYYIEMIRYDMLCQDMDIASRMEEETLNKINLVEFIKLCDYEQ